MVGFGLSNDERRGRAEDFAPAFRIAARAGLLAAPHGGELLGPEQRPRPASTCWAPTGSGTASARPRTRRLVDRLADRGVTLRGVPDLERRARASTPTRATVPLRDAASTPASRSRWAPTTRCCSAPGWPTSTRLARDAHGFDDDELAELARCSVRGSAAPDDVRARLLAGIDAWLAAP